ncbi:hypothetical protein PSV08DRAFT_375076 [Bipolaris maydis]|uniref:uncharacterized protein n=1 Tax=Cochliobolus heterostrophus TaxID=5016 RepID=UPI0024DBAF39|nr:hypothetical protein J3E73DRAFT_394987 [Bipolaris maydis]KAJ6265978.1 hypothetical protein PSV08DRAFT_375076 [Bipolaris maydis]
MWLIERKQTNGGIAVFTSGAVLSDAPGFHWHHESQNVFLKVIHNPELLGPHTETFDLAAPGDWVNFFLYVGETYGGVIVPDDDNRNLKSTLIPKLMAFKDRFDVRFKRDYQAPELGSWADSENQLPTPEQAYFLQANKSPRWILGGVLSRPFIHAEQTGEKFAILSIESSNFCDVLQQALSCWLTLSGVDYCFCVQEGLLRGRPLVLAAGETFSLNFGSQYVRVWSFTNGRGIEELIKQAGERYDGFVIPDVPVTAGGHAILTAYQS